MNNLMNNKNPIIEQLEDRRIDLERELNDQTETFIEDPDLGNKQKLIEKIERYYQFAEKIDAIAQEF